MTLTLCFDREVVGVVEEVCEIARHVVRLSTHVTSTDIDVSCLIMIYECLYTNIVQWLIIINYWKEQKNSYSPSVH